MIDRSSIRCIDEIAEEGSTVAEAKGQRLMIRRQSHRRVRPRRRQVTMTSRWPLANARMPLAGAPLDGADGIPNRPALASKCQITEKPCHKQV